MTTEVTINKDEMIEHLTNRLDQIGNQMATMTAGSKDWMYANGRSNELWSLRQMIRNSKDGKLSS